MAKENKPPVLVELFTSQGCHSCPPADALLGKLSHQPDLITLAYHVTYWDYLGWKDQFATEWGTERQKSYARSLKLNTLYTPQMIIDGRHYEVGSNQNQIRQLIALRQRDKNRINIEIKNLNSDYRVRLDQGSLNGDPGKVKIIAVYYMKEKNSKILAGENRGKTLNHRTVALTQEVIGNWKGGDVEYVVKKPSGKNIAGVAVFAQIQKIGSVIGSAKLIF